MQNFVGKKYTTNEGYTIEILEQFRGGFCSVIFDDGTILTKKRIDNIKRGKIKNPNHKSVRGIGFIGVGKYNSFLNIKNNKIYKVWIDMFKRCYSYKFQEKHLTYKGCSVCEEWHNYQNFAEWANENYIEGYELDKDILVKGNKMYSKQTCCFVPKEINSLNIKHNLPTKKLPLGVSMSKGKFQARLRKKNITVNIGSYESKEQAFEAYKKEKEKYVKEVAEKWKGKITQEVFEALINHEINSNN